MGELKTVMAGAEPFFHRGGRVGCLVLHGFTGTPQEVRELGGRIAALGHTVFGPRLPGHGVEPADLNRARWHDWYLAAEDAYHVLAAQCDHVVVVGLSMGASTGLLLSTRLPVLGVAALSTPLTLWPDWRLPFVGWVWPLVPYSLRTDADDTWVDPGAPARRVDYRLRPLRGVAELVRYLRFVRSRLASVHVPLLLVHSRTDRTAPPSGMETIRDLVASEQVETVWIENSDHAMAEDASREEVFAHVVRFVQERVARAPVAATTSPPR